MKLSPIVLLLGVFLAGTAGWCQASGRQSDSLKVRSLLDSAWTMKYSSPDAAMGLIRSAYAYSEQRHFRRGRADALYYEAVLYYLQGTYDSALTVSSRALIVYDSLQLEKSRASIRNLHGLIHEARGEYLPAIEAFQESFRISNRYEDPVPIANPLHNIGMVYDKLRAYERAGEYYRQSYEIRRKTGDPLQMGQSELSLGELYYHQKQPDSAEYFLKKCLQNSHNGGDLYSVSRALNILGIIELESERLAQAWQTLDQAQTIMDSSEDRTGLIMVLMNKGLVRIKQKRYDEAEPLLMRALDLSREQGVPHRQEECLRLITDVQTGLGDYKAAFDNQLVIQSLRDSLYNIERTEQFAELEARFRVEQKENQLLQERLKLQQSEARTATRTYLLGGIILGLVLLFGLIFLGLRLRLARLQTGRERLHFQALIQGEEKERARLARELHDGLGQLLSATKMQVSVLEDYLPESEAESGRALGSSMEMLDRAVQELRQISHNLMPPALERKGLVAALREIAFRLSNAKGPEVTFECPDPEISIPGPQAVALYRIAQEAVNNALKHAEASRIALALHRDGPGLLLEISDNGCGFDPAKDDSGGLGSRSLQLRASLLGGDLQVISSPGAGTTIRTRIPIHLPDLP